VNFERPALIAAAAFFLAACPLCAQHGGGGHAGSGSGHSVGHAIGQLFGHHPGGSSKGSPDRDANGTFPPLFGAATGREAAAARFNPNAALALELQRSHRPPASSSEFLKHRKSFPLAHAPFSGFCGSWSAFPRRSFFSGDLDCFQSGFFFDPFFFGDFYPYAAGFWNSNLDSNTPDSPDDPDESDVGSRRPPSRSRAPDQPDTLLQLTDGSMYGLTAYWLEGDRLHYITNYGGENFLPLSRIDLGKTMELNAARGIHFELAPKPAGE
jgi:hypothetical protein